MNFKKNYLITTALIAFQLTVIQAQVTFADPVENPFGLDFDRAKDHTSFVDIDGDGDLDIISITYNEIANDIEFGFSENISNDGGLTPAFVPTVPQYLGIELPFTGDETILGPTLADIDNDGDFDLFIGIGFVSEDVLLGGVLFYENRGTAVNPLFAEGITNPFNINFGEEGYLSIPQFVDIDADGDFDLFSISAEYNEEIGSLEQKFIYLENTGNAEEPHFVPFEKNPFGLVTSDQVYPMYYSIGDIDNDGDYDVISSDYNIASDENESFFKLYENKGNGQNPDFDLVVMDPFGLDSLLTYMAWPVLGDIDNDGDLDMLTMGTSHINVGQDAVFYYENLLNTTAVTETQLMGELSIYPTITNDNVYLSLKTNDVQAFFKINVFNAKGTLLSSEKQIGGTSLNEKIKLNSYPAGMYLIQISTDKGVLVREVLKQ